MSMQTYEANIIVSFKATDIDEADEISENLYDILEDHGFVLEFASVEEN